VIIAFLLQFAITYLPFLQPVFRTQALSFREFVLVGVASSLVFIAVEIEKAVSGKRRRMNSVMD
jgi:Ca2+-transporting ATPase